MAPGNGRGSDAGKTLSFSGPHPSGDAGLPTAPRERLSPWEGLEITVPPPVSAVPPLLPAQRLEGLVLYPVHPVAWEQACEALLGGGGDHCHTPLHEVLEQACKRF